MYKEYARMSGKMLSYSHILDTRKYPTRRVPHYHVDEYEIAYIIGKDIKYFLKGSALNLYEHSVVIVPPMCIHTFHEFAEKEGFEEYFIKINEKLIGNPEMAKFLGDGIVVKSEENSMFHNLFQKLDNYCKELNQEDFTDIMSALMKELLYNIKISKINNDIISSKPIPVNRILTDALSYIFENYSTIKSVSEIANHLYISERYLSKIFEKYFEVSPKKCLIHKRLNEAKHLLANGTKPTDVCYLTGFSDYTVFYRNYTSYFGHPPSKALQ